VLVVGVRRVIARWRLPKSALTMPLFGLALLALIGPFRHSSEASTWSVLAAKFFVPFAMFWMARIVFQSERSLPADAPRAGYECVSTAPWSELRSGLPRSFSMEASVFTRSARSL